MPANYRANALHATGPYKTQQLRWASPNQQFLFNYGPEPICASGGFGAGKTIGFARKILWLLDKFPGNRVMIARSLFEHLKKTTMPSFFKICPPEAYKYGRRADSDKSLRLNPVLCADGKVRQSELIWMHMDDPALADIIKGLEINAFLLDQAEDMAEEVFEKLLARLGRWDDVYVPPEIIKLENEAGRAWEWYDEESGDPRPPTYGMLTCNPEDELHWIYKRFHPEAREHVEPHLNQDGTITPSFRDQGYKMVFMDSTENIFLSKDNRQRMLNNDESFVRRYVKGQWGIPEGVIHNVSKQSEVEATPEALEYIFKTCRLHRILDHGDVAPTCCTWWASDRDGNLICFREYYEPDRLISYHRTAITDLSVHIETRDDQPTRIREKYDIEQADPSIFIKTMQKHGGRWSVANEYSDVDNQDDPDKALKTSIVWSAADNNEFATRNRLSEYLKVDADHLNPFTRLKGAPKMYFIKKSADYPHGCDMLIRETRSQRREQIGNVLGKPQFSEERKKKIPDHAYDTARYIVAARPGVAVAPQEVIDPMSFHRVRMDHIKSKRAGRFTLLAKRAEKDADSIWGRRRRG